ncbi:MAG: DUF4342 domain-containing protein [Spirochaetales bacterium]|nr:DUF4342 domain-containing protein [Spirochaetales bacterium]
MSDENRSKTKVAGEDLIRKIKEIVREGNVRKIVIRDDKGKQLLELPLAVGLLGIAIAPLWAVLGTVGAVAMNYTLEIIRKDDAEKSSAPEKKADA